MKNQWIGLHSVCTVSEWCYPLAGFETVFKKRSNCPWIFWRSLGNFVSKSVRTVCESGVYVCVFLATDERDRAWYDRRWL